MPAIQVREASPGVWSCYWTDGKGVLQAVVMQKKPPIAEVTVENGLHVMKDEMGFVLAKQGKDRDDSEFDDDFHIGDVD